ncbi:MAG: hypothetical protein ACYS9X_27685 [Planctomycetota bacterium]
MNSGQLLEYLEAIDGHLEGDTVLVIYGSAAFMLLGEPERSGLRVSVAAPYSTVAFPDLERAAAKAGIEVNPDETCADPHIEWVAPARLCLPAPDESTSQVLWRGARLVVKTVSSAELIASKLIRYDEVDAGDVRFLCGEARVSFDDVAKAAERLPRAFRDDAVLRENLAALKADMELWRSER